MLQMLGLAKTVDKDFIKVDNHKLTQERFKHLVHYPHESAWCIGQPKRHDHPLVQSFQNLEQCLPFISQSNANLMVAEITLI